MDVRESERGDSPSPMLHFPRARIADDINSRVLYQRTNCGEDYAVINRRPEDFKGTGGGRRGQLTCFSTQSKREMVRRLLTIKEKDGFTFHAVTMTLSPHYNGDFKVTLRRLRQWFDYKTIRNFHRLELTRRGIPHIHLVLQVEEDFDWDRLREYWFEQGGDFRRIHMHRGVWHEPVQHMGQYANYLRKSDVTDEPLVLPHQRQWGYGGPLEFWEPETLAEGSARDLAPDVRIAFGLENAERKKQGRRCLPDKGTGKIRLDAGSVIRNAHRVFVRRPQTAIIPAPIADAGHPAAPDSGVYESAASDPNSPAPLSANGIFTREETAVSPQTLPVSLRRTTGQRITPSSVLCPVPQHTIPIPVTCSSPEKTGGGCPVLRPPGDGSGQPSPDNPSAGHHRSGGVRESFMVLEKLGAPERVRVIGVPEVATGMWRQITLDDGQTAFVTSVRDAIQAERTGQYQRQPCDAEVHLHHFPDSVSGCLYEWRRKTWEQQKVDNGMDGWTWQRPPFYRRQLPVWDGKRPQAKVLFIDPMAFSEEWMYEGYPASVDLLKSLCVRDSLVPVLSYTWQGDAEFRARTNSLGNEAIDLFHAIHGFRFPSWCPTPRSCQRIELVGAPSETVREAIRQEWLDGHRPTIVHGMMDFDVTDWGTVTSCRSGAKPGNPDRELYVGPEFDGLPCEEWLESKQGHPLIERWARQ